MIGRLWRRSLAPAVTSRQHAKGTRLRAVPPTGAQGERVYDDPAADQPPSASADPVGRSRRRRTRARPLAAPGLGAHDDRSGLPVPARLDRWRRARRADRNPRSGQPLHRPARRRPPVAPAAGTGLSVECARQLPALSARRGRAAGAGRAGVRRAPGHARHGWGAGAVRARLRHLGRVRRRHRWPDADRRRPDRDAGWRRPRRDRDRAAELPSDARAHGGADSRADADRPSPSPSPSPTPTVDADADADRDAPNRPPKPRRDRPRTASRC